MHWGLWSAAREGVQRCGGKEAWAGLISGSGPGLSEPQGPLQAHDPHRAPGKAAGRPAASPSRQSRPRAACSRPALTAAPALGCQAATLGDFLPTGLRGIWGASLPSTMTCSQPQWARLVCRDPSPACSVPWPHSLPRSELPITFQAQFQGCWLPLPRNSPGLLLPIRMGSPVPRLTPVLPQTAVFSTLSLPQRQGSTSSVGPVAGSEWASRPSRRTARPSEQLRRKASCISSADPRGDRPPPQSPGGTGPFKKRGPLLG